MGIFFRIILWGLLTLMLKDASAESSTRHESEPSTHAFDSAH
jgi:hypothetical protein